MKTIEQERAAVEGPVDERRYTVAVDFDGVIHSYVSGWQGGTVIPDPPVPGAIEWMTEVASVYELVVLTTRAREPGGAEAVKLWLAQNGLPFPVLVTAEKPMAVFYLDDRGWRFRGRFPTLMTIRRAQPWKVGDPPPKSARDAITRAKEAQRKAEEANRARKHLLKLTRYELAREILRDKPDEWFDAWWEEVQKEPWEKRIEFARVEAGRERPEPPETL
jgi:hypothetical protein